MTDRLSQNNISPHDIMLHMEDVPIGKDDFKDIRENGIYLVDKTRFIGEILSMPGTEVFLFTRPRRFGKSINMSMLDAYLNERYRWNNWFDGLWTRTRRKDHSVWGQLLLEETVHHNPGSLSCQTALLSPQIIL